MSIAPSPFSRRAVSGSVGLAAGLAVGAAFLLAAGPARAQLVTFTATDSGAGPGSTPVNSNAKAAQFDAAAALLGPMGLITFESAPVGPYTSLAVAPGVTLTGLDITGNPQTINNTPNFPTSPARDGFNTTLGGAKYVEATGGTLTFTFAAPVQAFGAYFTGIQPFYFQDTLTFNDGTSQSIDVPAGDTSSGGVSFAGFTDRGKAITQVTINATNPATRQGDFIGVDDVRFGPVPAVPEASTTVSLGLLLALGMGGLVVAARRKKAHTTI